MKNKILLKGGCVVTMDEQLQIFKQADVLISGEVIIDISPSIIADDCEIIDATDRIVMPGFIDTHRHVWESVLRGIAGDFSLMEYLQNVLGPTAAAFRTEDVYIANLIGALEALDAGITTVFDWSHIMNTPFHADSAIAGLKDAGIRGVFGYGTPGTSVWEWFYESKLNHPQDIVGICKQHFSSPDQLITPAMAIRGPEYSTLEVCQHDIRLARQLNLLMSMHVGCGSFAGKYKAIEKLDMAGLLGSDMNFAHCNFLNDSDFKNLADNGCSVSITPEVEMQMGLGFPATGKAMAAGINPALGIDVVTGVGGDMFTQMRMALQTERAIRNERILDTGEMPQTVSPTMMDVLKMATINGARSLNLNKKTGSLTKGKQADIILLKTDTLNLSPVINPVAAIVSQANAANIDSVFVAGKAVKRNGHLLHPNMAGIKQQAESSAYYLSKQVQISNEEYTV